MIVKPLDAFIADMQVLRDREADIILSVKTTEVLYVGLLCTLYDGMEKFGVSVGLIFKVWRLRFQLPPGLIVHDLYLQSSFSVIVLLLHLKLWSI